MINDKVYNIDFRKWVQEELPFLFRKPKWFAVLFGLIKPIIDIHLEFIIFKNRIRYLIDHDGSVISLEAVLNDSYDRFPRRIYIKNSEVQDSSHFYDANLGTPVYFYDGDPEILYDLDRLSDNNADFTVFMPIALRPVTDFEIHILETSIRATVDTYRLTGKKYTLQWLN